MKFPSFTFPGIEEHGARQNERLIIRVHKHWFALFREVAGIALLFIVPLIAIPVAGTLFATSSNAADLGAITVFFASLWALICWSLLFARWTDYYFDILIITNLRIIDVDLRGLFHVDISSILDLDNIQDIKTESIGIVRNLLGFGRIVIQTASSAREFKFEDAPYPRRIEKLIRNAQEELLVLKNQHSNTLHP